MQEESWTFRRDSQRGDQFELWREFLGEYSEQPECGINGKWGNIDHRLTPTRGFVRVQSNDPVIGHFMALQDNTTDITHSLDRAFSDPPSSRGQFQKEWTRDSFTCATVELLGERIMSITRIGQEASEGKHGPSRRTVDLD